MAWISGDLLKELQDAARILNRADEKSQDSANSKQSLGPIQKAPQNFSLQFRRPI